MGRKIVTRPDWLNRTPKERFDEKWILEPFSGCWLWTSELNWNGYGAFSYKLRRVTAHRMSWFLKHGEMPPSSVDVCHKCDTRSCVNPDHLFLGTRKDNMQDSVSKGRRTYHYGDGVDWSFFRKTSNPIRSHCVHGHAFIGGNIYVSKDGVVSCKECRRLSARRRRGVL